MVQSNEQQLLDRAMHGDRSALGELLERYQHRLYNVVLRMVYNRDDAAELTQQALLKIVEHIHDYNGKAAISTWMIRITMNLTISHLRKQRLRQTVSLDAGQGGENRGWAAKNNGQDAGSALHNQLSDSREQNPAQSVQQREMLTHLRTAMARLEEDLRAVLVLRDIDEMDYQHIADVLGIPVGTVKSRLFRARLALRHEMFKLFPPVKTTGMPATGTDAGLGASEMD